MTKSLPSLLLVGLFASAGVRPAIAATTFYTDQNAFGAAAGPVTTFGFSGVAQTGYDTAAGLTVSGVNFVGTKAGGYSLGVQGPNFYGNDYDHGLNEVSLQGPALTSTFYTIVDGATTITFAGSGVTALGLNLFDVLTGTSDGSGTDLVNLSANGATGSVVTPQYMGAAFLGVVSSTPLTSVTLTGTAAEEFPTIVQVSYASAAATIDTSNGDIAPNLFSLASPAARAAILQFDGGILQMSSGSFPGNIVAAPVTISPTNGAIDTSTGNGGFSGVVSGPGSLTVAGGGTFSLSNANTYAGGTVVNASTVTIGDGAALGTGALTLNGGTLRPIADGLTIENAVVLAGSGSIDTNGFTLNEAGAISGTGLLAKAGAGTLVLAGANDYAGATTIAAGTLRAGSTTGLSPASAFTVGAGATLDLAGFDSEVGALAGGGTVLDSGAAAVLTTGRPGASTSFGGLITDGAGSLGLRKVGGGTLTLTGADLYSGGTMLDAGTIALGNGQALGSGTVSMADGTRLAFLGPATLGNAVTFAGTAGATIDTGPNGDTMSGVISGRGALMKAGTGLLTLTGANTYTGGTLLGAGRVAIGNGQALGSGPLSLADGTTLAFLSGGSPTRLANAIVLNGTSVSPTVDAGANVVAVLDGVVSGVGGLSKTGAGQVLLSATETYTGGTVIGAGQLQVGIGGTTGSIAGNVVDNAALAFARADALTFAGVVAGTGTLTEVGPGLLTLTGANTYSGGTTLAGGILQVTNATLQGGSTVSSSVGTGPLSFSGGTLRAGADLTLAMPLAVGLGGGTIDNNGRTLTVSGTIADGAVAGRLTLVGGLATVLTGANTYTGGTALDAGTVAIGNGQALGSGPLTMADGTTLAFLGSFTFGNAVAFTGAADPTIDTGPNNDVMSGTLSGGGALTKAGTGSLTLTGLNTYTGGTVVTAGTLIGSATSFGPGGIADAAALVLDQPTTASLGNPISGTGTLIKTGAGALDLTGIDSLSGPTTVAAGTLVVDGSLANSAVTVGSGATLGGFGTVGGFNALQGATVAPGVTTPFSALKVGGNVAFQPGSTYRVAINAAGRSDSIQSTGAATLNGAGVSVLVSGSGYSAGTTYRLLTAPLGVSGTFGTLNTSLGFAFLTPTLRYAADTVTLGFTSNGVQFAAAAATPNQGSVAVAAQGLGAGTSVFNALQGLTADQARAALDSLSGAPHTSVVTAATQDARRMTGLIFDRLMTIGSGGIDARTLLQQLAPRDGPALPVNCFLPLPAVTPPPTTYTVWGEGFGDFGHDGGNRNGAGLDRSTGGFVLGIDAPIHGFTAPYRVGFAGGYSNDTLNGRGSTAAGTYQSVFGTVYAGARYGSVDVRGGASAAGTSTELDRAVAFPGFAETEHSAYAGHVEQVFGEVGYRFAGQRWVVEPIAGASYVHVHQDSYRERGGAAALAGKANDNDVGTTTLGAHADYAPLAGVPLVGKLFLGWRHAFGDVDPTTRLVFEAGGASFAEQGAPIDIDALAAEAGVDWVYSDKVTLGVSYVGQVGARDQDHGGKGRFEVKF